MPQTEQQISVNGGHLFEIPGTQKSKAANDSCGIERSTVLNNLTTIGKISKVHNYVQIMLIGLKPLAIWVQWFKQTFNKSIVT